MTSQVFSKASQTIEKCVEGAGVTHHDFDAVFLRPTNRLRKEEERSLQVRLVLNVDGPESNRNTDVIQSCVEADERENCVEK